MDSIQASMYEDLSDSEIITKLHRSREEEKQEIFLTLYDRYKHLVLKSCYYYLTDYDAANDAFHDVFVKVIEKVETLKNPAVFKSWLMTITRNLCVDQLRKTSYLTGQKPLTTEIEVYSEERTEDRLVAELDRQKILTHLTSCIQNLDSFQLNVFRLRWQGLKSAQILKITKAEKTDLRRSYDKIKSILETCMGRKGFKISIEQIISLGEIDE
jgi:RNA polymerase sigma-70 factor, ECF subfamily